MWGFGYYNLVDQEYYMVDFRWQVSGCMNKKRGQIVINFISDSIWVNSPDIIVDDNFGLDLQYKMGVNL